MPYVYRMIQNSSTVLKEADNLEQKMEITTPPPPPQIRHCFKWRRFSVAVTLDYCGSLMGAPRWGIVEVQTAEAQLSDSDSSTGNKSDKSPPHGH
jgi:hypothetical protein